VHNMCRLRNSNGVWAVVEGGMGTVPKIFAEAAKKAGVQILLNKGVKKFLIENQSLRGVLCQDGTKIGAKYVVVNADPFRMVDMIEKKNLPTDYLKRIDNYRRDGTTLKLNMSLKALPKFTCLPESKGQHGTTTHILPQENVSKTISKAFKDASEGKLPEFPAIEWYIHSTIDPSIRDQQGYHSSALFVQWVPYELKGTTWEKEEEKYIKHLLGILDQFAPGTSELVTETFCLTPPKIEKHFGVTKGHIHHVDNTFGFADRLPYRTPIKGLYSCSAGTHPGGSVIGCGGHNSAMSLLKDIGNVSKL